MRSYFPVPATFLFSFLGASSLWSGPLAPTHLRCEYLQNPTAIDVAVPRFAWVLNHTDRSQHQTSYELQVSRDARFKGVVWNSGEVNTPDTFQVEYKGPPLASDTTYLWRVRFRDANGAESPWSDTAEFSTGMLQSSDWKAKWITGSGLLRDFITLSKPVKRARLFVAASGYYEFHINDYRIGDHVLDPAWTDYSKRVLYSAYDVTKQLHSGGNTLRVLVGRAWYGKILRQAPKLICQIQGEYENGKPFLFTSDENWRAYKSPITLDDIYDGETYDARLETEPAERDAGQPVSVVDLPGVTLSSQMMPAIQIMDTLVPRKMTESSPGIYVYDFEQNFSGWAKIKVHGPAGTRVQIRYAELVNPDGSVMLDNLRSARSTDTYILRGDPNGEEYEAHFTYHGFRYVELSGFPSVPSLDSVRGREVHTAVETIGNFASSDPMLNAIQHMFIWSIKTNLASVPTDCDQRDERLGWMGDAHLSAETAILNFDMAAFYTNFLRDIRDAQGSQGEVPNIVPFIERFNKNRVGDPSWGLAYPLLVQYLYRNYADKRIVQQHYEGIKAWADFLHRHAPDGTVDYSYFGDWVGIDATPKLLAGTWAYIKALDIVAMAADVLGKEDEAKQYRDLATMAREAFNRKWRSPEGVYGSGSQAAQVLALNAHVIPGREEGETMSRLLDDVNYYHNVHLTTGILGTKYLFPVLASRGHADLAFEVLTQPDYPGYGFMLSHGATTLWELWQDRTGPEMNSHNHHMFASAGTFLFNVLAGINRGEGLGYSTIRIQPELVHGLNWVSASTETVRGGVSSAWRRIGPGYELKVTVPVGATASVHFQLLKLADPEISETGTPLYRSSKPQIGGNGVSNVHMLEDDVVCDIGSGDYVFRVGERTEPAAPNNVVSRSSGQPIGGTATTSGAQPR
ncbi:MAG: family 78 glycoside hydrolase catalytic domain [Acidobacteriaceae bacterium]|nr:family 78 glycoside hydrolase catalytic domain [Acidobacteriaceae bacterium]MBV9498369.1 family 78 glycoside hydrolase catalytic domain [Acidobacteriaceae bacterium]